MIARLKAALARLKTLIPPKPTPLPAAPRVSSHFALPLRIVRYHKDGPYMRLEGADGQFIALVDGTNHDAAAIIIAGVHLLDLHQEAEERSYRAAFGEGGGL